MSCNVVTTSPTVKYIEANNQEHNKDDSIDILDLCDASTVVNVSLLKKDNTLVGIRKHESESELLDDCSTIPETQIELASDRTDKTVDRVVKVVGWLERSQLESHKGSDNLEEFAKHSVIDDWLNKNPPSPLFIKNIRRVGVFLLDVDPSPANEPLDLVSGYCYDGCKRFSAYSMVVWSQEDGYDIPLCPHCSATDIEKELKFMFKFALKVMDPQGLHVDFHIWKEHAEVFFGCSTYDFIRKSSVREAAVVPLRKYTVACTMYDNYSPLLDLSVVYINHFFFVVNSSLKPINKCNKGQDL